MNRKKAIRNIVLLGGGAAAVLAGWKSYNIFKKPSFSSLEEHQLLIDELAELIIPETTTPGAGKAGVGRFISLMIRECT
ncbi:MAG: gluconate 2-dehydrogenase subunit 3 family protein, partial [Sphingobacteriales bacterium]